jgi:tRNA A-37 threonylcarbamoyl transferase component Bud32
MRKRLLYAADPRWAAMAGRLDELVAAGRLHLLKDEGRTYAGLLPGHDGVPVFVKRTRAGSWMRGLVAAARGSQVKRWLGGAAMLGAAGFSRPAPLVALEVRRAGAVVECYLVCEALRDAAVLSRAVLGGGSVNFRRRRALLAAVAREVCRLHDAGLYTRDLQETNLMVEERAGASLRIWFVDLEDFRRARSVSWHTRLTNLVHLDRSLGRFLGRATRMRFLCDYLDGMALGREERRRLVTQLLRLRTRVESRRRARGAQQPAAAPPTPLASPDPAAAAGAAGLAPPAGD